MVKWLKQGNGNTVQDRGAYGARLDARHFPVGRWHIISVPSIGARPVVLEVNAPPSGSPMEDIRTTRPIRVTVGRLANMPKTSPAQRARLLRRPDDSIIWYISFLGGGVWIMHTAKVFQNGRSQAIRLPKEFRVEADEVQLKKTPEGFLVIARDPWSVFFEGVAELSNDFMADGRGQPEPQPRKWKS